MRRAGTLLPAFSLCLGWGAQSKSLLLKFPLPLSPPDFKLITHEIRALASASRKAPIVTLGDTGREVRKGEP